MEIQGIRFSCPNCGSSVTIDFKTRIGTCDSCGYTTEFKRNFFNSNDKVVNDLTNVVRYFKERNFKQASRFAEDVLNVAVDNVPATFVLAYSNAYIDDVRNSKSMAVFFDSIRDIPLDPEELDPLKAMFLACVTKLDVFEEDILDKVMAGSHAPQLLEFVDSFSPFLINRRANMDFLTPRLVGQYVKCARVCGIPKTCYALLNAIRTNPDSPYNGNTFFLKTKTERFYNSFVLPIGEIIKNMSAPALNVKFGGVYKKQKEEFESKMKGGTNNV